MSTGHRQDRMVVLMDDSLTAVNRVVSVLRARQCEVEALTLCAADAPALRMTFCLVSGPRAEQVASWLARCQEVRHAAVETADGVGKGHSIDGATREEARDRLRHGGNLS